MKRQRPMASHCPVNFGLEATGDRWALLILRNIIFRGHRTFSEFLRSEEGMASNILTSRLHHLVEQGILQQQDHPDDARRGLYELTEKGLDLIPLVFELTLWSALHDPESEARRIPGLIERIRNEPRVVAAEARQAVLAGEAFVRRFLKT
jgi:DNA-binding HxlR family transcriptional regulator